MANPRNTRSKFAAERAPQHILTRFNPIRGLTPLKLARQLDGFWAGNLRECAMLWQKIQDRDDQVITCSGKRARKVTGLPWEVLTIDKSPRAQEHKDALEHFYNNVRAINALDENEQGGMRTLLRQMHSAVGMRYAVHEIVWRPGAARQLTAEFKFIPLQFFENTQGRLRYLQNDYDPYGADLDEHFGEGGWMVTTGPGLMEATSVAKLFKDMPLKAWVRFCDKFGIPPLHAETNASKGSEEWEALKVALRSFGEDLGVITSLGAKINPIELKNAGNSPHAPLVDRMDRAISRIWLGGDLATMSAGGQAVGSEPQSDDLGELQADDAAMLTDALQHFVDRWVIRYLFDEEPLAYIELQPAETVDTARELAIDDKLISWGVEISKKDLRQRYGRSEPDQGEDLARAPAAAPALPGIAPRPFGAAINEKRASAIASLQAAQREQFAPLLERLGELESARDPVSYDVALRAFANEADRQAPAILRNPTLARAIEGVMAEAAARGAVETLSKK